MYLYRKLESFSLLLNTKYTVLLFQKIVAINYEVSVTGFPCKESATTFI